MFEQLELSTLSKVGGVVASSIALLAGAGYVYANSSFLHRGKSGFGSCTTATEVVSAVYGKAPKCGMDGRTVIVTGPNSGIGKETARALALGGCHVVLPCRSMKKAEDTKLEIEEFCAKRGVKAKLTPSVLDLNDFASVRAFATSFQELGMPLHALICNAGIMAIPERTPTVQGFESQVGVCHLAHFLLTKLLLPELKKAKTSRVVCVSSMGHRLAPSTDWIESDTLEGTEYEPWRNYGYAKMSNILFAKELTERYQKDGVTGYSLHPGGMHTGLQTHVPLKTKIFWAIITPYFFKSLPQGAATSVFCAVHPTAVPGSYHSDCNAHPCDHDDWVQDATLRARFWATSEALVERT